MSGQPQATHAPVRRQDAGGYLLSFLVAFSGTVIATRVMLHLTGFPQLGNDTLHIAHALWGGLLLVIATLLPLIFSNAWALQLGALVGGTGVGLFIDEVGKFITQANDYFFAPALPLIYGFFLVCVILYHLIRQPIDDDPRHAMYQALDALKEVVDRDLDAAERKTLEDQLATARRSADPRTARLADAVGAYLAHEATDLPSIEYDLWTRVTAAIDRLALRLARARHRALILGLTALWAVLVFGSVYALVLGGPDFDPQLLRWRVILVGIQAIIGLILLAGLGLWLARREAVGLEFAIAGFLLSLAALQTLYFYISQGSAVVATLLQFLSLQVLLVYRRLYRPVAAAGEA